MQVEYKFHNDKKEKRQSQELKIEISISETDLDVYGDINLLFYGVNKEEVIKNKNIFIDNLIEALNKIKVDINI